MEQLIPEEVLTNATVIENLVAVAKDAALQHGVLMRIQEAPNSSEVRSNNTFTNNFFPLPVPEALYNQALSLQKHFNTLVDRISQDSEFLKEALASTIEVDDFTSRLFKIHQQVLEEGRSSSITMGLNRSDYMMDQRDDGPVLKQIEINTIAASFGGLSTHTPEVHRKTLHLVGRFKESQRILDNNVAAGLAGGLAKAWELYGSEKAVVMFLVEDKQRNIFDQRCVEYELWKRNVPTTRKRFDVVYKTGSLDQDKKLFVDGLEVAVVYFRNGYMPDQYVSEQSWETRLMMERSKAVKCPDISTHLTGTKKVQQVLAKPGVVERFFPEQPEVAQQIRATFAGLYTLDQGPEGDKAEAMALAEPERFVLKPQREGGGGNNIYGKDIVEVLQGLKGSTGRMAYILMDKIQPVPSKNYLLRRDNPVKMSNCLSELGVYGAYVRHGKDMVMNQCVGHLLRTKSNEDTDGGVAAGVAVLDNPVLF
ncbi:glutathione synthetase [Cynoglossus semilaevis]|uniref:glutathione synthetase n=1 Tax=Cynoglossus semilaevis TaxID=244447 RepID=UPI000497DB14|nr:glutathione synthetase [Cynoglossus semilaevis]